MSAGVRAIGYSPNDSGVSVSKHRQTFDGSLVDNIGHPQREHCGGIDDLTENRRRVEINGAAYSEWARRT
ncbi:MAG TPA: hypothetical protein VK137_11870, partial [Planctomycetaceae bacterium]|nr:hypothetical protein [Planctomycetaceae bacterium]